MENTQKYLPAALGWLDFGLQVIPITPGTKKTALKWDGWLDGLSPGKVTAHWSNNPDDEVGCIVGDGLIVADADSPVSAAALALIEDSFDINPSLIIKTTKGEHHYYRRAPGTIAKSDSHSTINHPERLDIKTGRTMVVLPPSTGKNVEIMDVSLASELTEVGQGFIDAIFRHNGRPAPSSTQPNTATTQVLVPTTSDLASLKTLLEHIDPNCGYDDWLKVLMAVHHETGGSEDGLELADIWSSKGRNYKSSAEIAYKWGSFKRYLGTPITSATMISMVQAQGKDWPEICAGGLQFERCETIVDCPDLHLSEPEPIRVNPLEKYSLRGMSEEIKKMAVAAGHVLGKLALQGQATVFYAAANTGKTLITLNLLTEAIHAGRVEADKVYYLNVDDTVQGLVEKQAIADEFGFHMIAEGWRNFTVSAFLADLKNMIDNDTAHGVIIILDTLKKFTNLMDKGQSSHFAKFVRHFVLKGGTLIALAHTNKNPKSDGKPQYSGTSDIVDDFDCAFTIRMVSQSTDKGEKVVEFENIKRRGNVAPTASYSYTLTRDATYLELLLSVKPVNDQVLNQIKSAEEVKADAEVIKVVLACIADGINTKMNLAREVKQRCGISNKSALQVIEKYTGDDPSRHKWCFTVAARGAQVFVKLDQPKPDSDLSVP